MGRKLSYRLGSFYRQDDRSGFMQRAEDTRMEWNGRIVDEKLWEPRQPQDLVRGVKDVQSVPMARPKPPPAFYGPQSEQTSAAAGIGAILIPMVSLKGFNPGDKIGIMLSTGQYFFTWLLDFIDGELVILNPLPAPVVSGAIVTDFGPGDDPLTSGFLLQETGALIGIRDGGYIGVSS